MRNKNLKIQVTYGIGQGLTELSAFDAALHDAGIKNYNLISLSSVIPPSASLSIKKYRSDSRELGNRLYVVMSRQISSDPGKSLFAGLGWVYSVDGGIFVEHSGSNYNQVKEDIGASIFSMMQYRPYLLNKETHMKIVGIDKIQGPTCVLVVAIYASEAW